MRLCLRLEGCIVIFLNNEKKRSMEVASSEVIEVGKRIKTPSTGKEKKKNKNWLTREVKSKQEGYVHKVLNSSIENSPCSLLYS